MAARIAAAAPTVTRSCDAKVCAVLGSMKSIVSRSLLKRFSMRPMGVVSKKRTGEDRHEWSISPCTDADARQRAFATARPVTSMLRMVAAPMIA